jgi:hypothetical protein
LHHSTICRASAFEFTIGTITPSAPESTFTQGIVAGVPAGTRVSHKFGEFSAGTNLKQLHDCGIVYKPAHPYILCVMTQGNDFNNLAATIAKISKTVWDLNL